jgi:hypothetical protein
MKAMLTIELDEATIPHLLKMVMGSGCACSCGEKLEVTVDTVEETVEEKPKKAKAKKTKAVEEAPAIEPEIVQPEDAVAAPEPAQMQAVEVTEEQVRLACNAYARKHGVEAVKAKIKEFGKADLIKDVTRENYSALIAAVTEGIEEAA